MKNIVVEKILSKYHPVSSSYGDKSCGVFMTIEDAFKQIFEENPEYKYMSHVMTSHNYNDGYSGMKLVCVLEKIEEKERAIFKPLTELEATKKYAQVIYEWNLPPLAKDEFEEYVRSMTHSFCYTPPSWVGKIENKFKAW